LTTTFERPPRRNLDGPRAADLGLGGGHDVEDRVVERAEVAVRDRTLGELGGAALWPGVGDGRWRGGDGGVAHVAARAGRSGRRLVAEVAQDPLAAAARALDPGPHGAICRQRTRVPSCAELRHSASVRPSHSPASRPATRSGGEGAG
jgi:hypothetical protein